MVEQDIEDKLRRLGREWPIPTIRDFVSEKVMITPQLRPSVPKRRWAVMLLAGGLATAATILIVIATQLSTPVTLYAAVQRTLEKAGRAHVLIESFDKGARQFTEIWFDKALGVRTEHGNTIVVDDYRILNEDGLRFEDEFVKHKILDAIGDLYLSGHTIIGAFEGYKSGHAMNNRLLRQLFADQTAWEYVTFDKREQLPAAFGNMALSAA